MAVKFVIFLLAIAFSAEAARRVNVQERMMRARRDLDLGIERSPRNMMGLTRGEDLKEGRHVGTTHGNQKIKFQETYLGLPVEGASVVMEKNKRGQYTSNVVGSLVENLDEDLSTVEPGFDGSEAMRILARKNWDRAENVQFDPKTDATLEVMVGDSATDTVSARLVYKVSYKIENDEKLSRPYGIVDAESGEILKSWEGLSIHTRDRRQSSSRVESNYQVDGVGGNLKIGKTKYGGSAYKKLAITKTENGTCILSNNVAKVYSCENNWDCREYQNTPFSFECDKGFDDAINGAYSPLNDAMYYISATYDMFSEWYNIKNPLQREGSEENFCSARVHFGEAFQNAFWDGYYITFGDGNDTFYPFTSLGVVAHEISHGVTEMNSGLYYYGESGGMNEAFSDMSGEVVEYYARKKADWMIGYDIMKDKDKAMRYFTLPSDDGKSIDNQDDYCPGMDPHYSSGLFNRVFYFLSTTEGWNPRSAFHPFVVANELYWMAHSTFFEAACGVVQAAKDLELNSKDVVEAFRKVGVEPCVDTRKGLAASSEITVPAGHKVIYHLKIEDNMNLDVLTVSVNGLDIEAYLHSPTCDQCSLRGGWQNRIDVCKPSAGMYMLEFTADHDIVKGSVVFTGATTKLVSNASVANRSHDALTTFSFPDATVKSGQQVALTLIPKKGWAAAMIKHGSPPVLKDWIFDYILYAGRERFMCKVLPGKYYVIFKTWSPNGASGIDLSATQVLEGERIDKSPPVTRPPPSKEGSGD